MAKALHLGILSGPEISLSEEGQPSFGKAARYFQRLCLEARRRGIVCYVFPSSRSVAWTYSGKSWHEAGPVEPDVVYDRWIHRSPAEAERDQQIAIELERSGIPLINSSALMALVSDKWRVYGLLESIPRPETRLLDSPETLRAMLSLHGHVYLKPRSGNQTKQVMSVASSARGLRYALNSYEGLVSGIAGDAGHLIELLDGSMQYLVQQAVKPAEHDGRRIEIRVMMHKVPAGRWLRTGMVVRAGKRGTHFLSSGREVDLRPSDVIPAVFPRCHEEVLSAVRSIAREIPPLLEESGGPGAELAVDVIPDAAGKPWLLEVNSKPSSLFLNTDSIRLRNITIERILDYALSIRCTS